MTIKRSVVDDRGFNPASSLPFNLRIKDVALAMQDVYDFFYDVNSFLLDRGLPRLDDTIRPAIMSGLISDMLTESVAKHSRSLTPNRYHNGHPDLLVAGVYPENKAKAGTEGIEVKTTGKHGGAVDFHGARDQWVMVFVYDVDNRSEPASDRDPLSFAEVYLAQVAADDFRRNERGELGTRTATLDKEGLVKLRAGWLYKAT
jgi:hypothetical protein